MNGQLCIRERTQPRHRVRDRAVGALDVDIAGGLERDVVRVQRPHVLLIVGVEGGQRLGPDLTGIGHQTLLSYVGANLQRRS
jgi:hypothetical protein